MLKTCTSPLPNSGTNAVCSFVLPNVHCEQSTLSMYHSMIAMALSGKHFSFSHSIVIISTTILFTHSRDCHPNCVLTTDSGDCHLTNAALTHSRDCRIKRPCKKCCTLCKTGDVKLLHPQAAVCFCRSAEVLPQVVHSAVYQLYLLFHQSGGLCGIHCTDRDRHPGLHPLCH